MHAWISGKQPWALQTGLEVWRFGGVGGRGVVQRTLSTQGFRKGERTHPRCQNSMHAHAATRLEVRRPSLTRVCTGRCQRQGFLQRTTVNLVG